MAILKPFKALRPQPEFAQEVAAAPYDVINTEEARTAAVGKPNSFLHVTRSEIDLPEGTDPYDPAVYQKAADNLAALRELNVLIQDQEPALYVYRIRMGEHVQTGIVGTASVDEYDAGTIKKHEKTRPAKENDRTRHMLALGAQPGPVFLTYREDPEITALADAATTGEPLYSVTAEPNVEHMLWRVAQPAPFEERFAKVPCLYIADGHHRIASASRARAELRRANPAHTGEEPYNFLLSVIFPHNQLQILPYNRIIKELPGTPADLLEGLKEQFRVQPGASPEAAERGTFRLYLEGQWHCLTPKPEIPLHEDPVAALDVSILHARVLAPLLGIGDERTDPNVDFVGGIRGTAELERLVNERRAACAFSLHATSIEDLLSVADAGAIMAPKSTWFEPKLRSGLLIHPIK